MGRLVKLAIDYENPAPGWWKSGGRELWESIADHYDAPSVVLEEDLANSWFAEAARIPGWLGGPDYAPHPICLKSVAEDEEV